MAASVKQQTEQFIPVNPFCRPNVALAPIGSPDGRYIYRVEKVEIDPDTMVVSPVYEKVDSQAEIDACRGMCGMDLMQAKLKAGLASPEDYYDDGSSGADLTQIPADVHEMRRLADMQSDQLAALAQRIGIKVGEDVTAQQFEDALVRYIKENQAQFVAPQESEAK